MDRRVKKIGEGIFPFDDEAKKAFDRLPSNTLLYLGIKSPRNGRFHSKYFAMLNVIRDNYHEDVDIEHLNIHVKNKLFMWEAVVVGGVCYKIYDSISFAKMDEDAFGEFYTKAVQACLEIVPIDNKKLADQVANFG